MANVTPHRMITVVTADITEQKSLDDIDGLGDDLWELTDIMSVFAIRVVDMRKAADISGAAYLDIYWYDSAGAREANPRIHIKCPEGGTVEFGPFFPPHCQNNLLAVKYLNPNVYHGGALTNDGYVFVEIVYQETE